MSKYILLITAIFLTDVLHARDYFVSAAGLNTNSGTIASPLATIQYAIGLCLPGDTVQVRAGTYNQAINWMNSGTANHLITLKSYNGEAVIIDGTGQAASYLLKAENVNYIRITGIIFQNNYQQGANGIYVLRSGKHILIDNCVVKNIGWTNNPQEVPNGGQAHAILVNGRTLEGLDTVSITQCKVYNIISGNSEAITLTGNVKNFLVDRDTVYDTKNIGIDIAGHYIGAVETGVADSLNQARNGTISNCLIYNNRRVDNIGSPAGIYVDGGKNVKVLNNRSFRNANGISVGCENNSRSADNIVVMNNQVYENDIVGLSFGSGSSTSVVKNSVIINNTFFKNGRSETFGLEIRLQNGDSNVLVNNIVIPEADSDGGIGIFGYTSTHLTVDRNLLYRYSGNLMNLYAPGSPAQFTPTNTINADPLFTDTVLASLNLRISRLSPAIDAGANTYPLFFDKDAGLGFRVVNGKLDIGAFERQDGGCPDTFTIDDTRILTGKFVAGQILTFNRTQLAVLSNPLLWSSLVVQVKSPIRVAVNLMVDKVGCQ